MCGVFHAEHVDLSPSLRQVGQLVYGARFGASHTTEAVKGVLKEGGSGRRLAFERLISEHYRVRREANLTAETFGKRPIPL